MKTLSYDPLWKTLIDHNISKTEFAEKAKFSRTTLAKMGKNEVVSLEVIIRIGCSYFYRVFLTAPAPLSFKVDAA